MGITVVTTESELNAWVSARNSQVSYSEDEWAEIPAGTTIGINGDLLLDPVNAGSFVAGIRPQSGGQITGRLWPVYGTRSTIGLRDFSSFTIRGKGRVRGVQLTRTQTGGGGYRVGAGARYEQCIIDAGELSSQNLIGTITGGGKVVSSLIVCSSVSGFAANAEDTLDLERCTVVANGRTGNAFRSDFGGLKLNGTAVYGFSGDLTGSFAAGTTHNATSNSTALGTSGQTLLSSSDFVNVTFGSEDFARASSSTKLGNTGTALSGVLVDIFGTVLPQGVSNDIGAYEMPEVGDTTPPTLTGSITIGTVTSGSIQMSWPTGTDNVAVTSYEVSSNGGTSYTDVGNVTTYTFTGLTANTTYQLRVRAKDAAGNVSTPALATSQATSAASDTTNPTLTGTVTASSVTASGATISWPTGSDNVAVTGYEYSLNGGAYVNAGNVTTVNLSGLTQATFYGVAVRAYDAAGNRSTPAITGSFTTLTSSDTTPPTLTGSITIGTVTSGSIQMSWPTGTDNVAVTSYEVSSNGGTSYTDVGNVTTYTFTGLTASTTYQLRVRAKDAAGNVSTPALATSQATSAAPTVTKKVILVLTSDGTTAAANLTNLKWAFFDQVTPDLFTTAPSCRGAVETTNGTGVLEIDVSASSLPVGGIGWLTITDSNGTINQTPPAKAFSAPVQITS